MTDIVTIGSILTSLKTATDIAKLLRDTNFSLEQAETKLKLADLISSLADAKILLSEVQGEIGERDKRIKELEEAFQSKDELVKHRDGYYLLDQSGNPTGEAFCPRCWEVNHMRYHLYSHKAGAACLCCKTVYVGLYVRDI